MNVDPFPLLATCGSSSHGCWVAAPRQVRGRKCPQPMPQRPFCAHTATPFPPVCTASIRYRRESALYFKIGFVCEGFARRRLLEVSCAHLRQAKLSSDVQEVGSVKCICHLTVFLTYDGSIWTQPCHKSRETCGVLLDRNVLRSPASVRVPSGVPGLLRGHGSAGNRAARVGRANPVSELRASSYPLWDPCLPQMLPVWQPGRCFQNSGQAVAFWCPHPCALQRDMQRPRSEDPD